MANFGKCPHCKKTVSHAKIETITVEAGIYEAYEGVTYVCPHCHSVLGVGIDPLSLNADVVSRLLKALRKG
jgi:uncharacterized protein with PIN domain